MILKQFLQGENLLLDPVDNPTGGGATPKPTPPVTPPTEEPKETAPDYEAIIKQMKADAQAERELLKKASEETVKALAERIEQMELVGKTEAEKADILKNKLLKEEKDGYEARIAKLEAEKKAEIDARKATEEANKTKTFELEKAKLVAEKPWLEDAIKNISRIEEYDAYIRPIEKNLELAHKAKMENTGSNVFEGYGQQAELSLSDILVGNVKKRHESESGRARSLMDLTTRK